jgi:DNA-binding MarR family transcriptional regulator
MNNKEWNKKGEQNKFFYIFDENDNYINTTNSIKELASFLKRKEGYVKRDINKFEKMKYKRYFKIKDSNGVVYIIKNEKQFWGKALKS